MTKVRKEEEKEMTKVRDDKDVCVLTQCYPYRYIPIRNGTFQNKSTRLFVLDTIRWEIPLHSTAFSRA